MSAGAQFRAALEAERPLQIAGTINAYTALLAARAGFKAIYLSGAGVANASFGLPDLAMTTLNDPCSAQEGPLLGPGSPHDLQIPALRCSLPDLECRAVLIVSPPVRSRRTFV